MLARSIVRAIFWRSLFDIEALSDHTSPLPHMMPRPEAFAVAMRELGVDQDKHLVIYDDGNLFSAPRAWWMLRTFGVENVSILAGGLAGWKRDDLMLKEGDEDLPEGEFNVAFTPGAVVRVTDVLLASHEKPHRSSMPVRLRVLTQKLTNLVPPEAWSCARCA